MKKIFALFIVFVVSLTIVGCNNDTTVESISVIESTIPETILISEVNEKLNTIKIEVTKTDKNKETIYLKSEMISSEDLKKLEVAGQYSITITYENKTTVLNLTIEEDVFTGYLATVLYPDMSPVQGNVSVQWCDNKTCYMPIVVDQNGVAKNTTLKNGTYYIHLLNIPSGYTYNPNIYTATSDDKHVEIVLIPHSNFVNGEGNKQNPYVIGKDGYTISFDGIGASNVKYFSYTATETGKIQLISLAVDKLATNEIDPYLGFLGTSIDNTPDTSGNVSDIKNFTYDFDVVSGTTYYFAIFVSSAQSFPAEFDICLTFIN